MVPQETLAQLGTGAVLTPADKANAENLAAPSPAPAPSPASAPRVFTGKSPVAGKSPVVPAFGVRKSGGLMTPQGGRSLLKSNSPSATPSAAAGKTPTVTMTGRSEALEMLGEYESVEQSFQVASLAALSPVSALL